MILFKRPAFNFDFQERQSEFASCAMSTLHAERDCCVDICRYIVQATCLTHVTRM